MERIRAILPPEIEEIFGDKRTKCRNCGLSELSYPVHPRGNFKAKSAWIAEAAGRFEEDENLVFNGPAADELEKVASKLSINVDIDFLIYNVAMCRPRTNDPHKENRPPTMGEVRSCRPNLEKIIRAHNPQLIVACGGVAAAGLMKDYPGAVNKVAGKFFGPKENLFDLDADMYVVWHPAYVLRNLQLEKDWGQQLMRLRDYMLVNNLLS